VNESPAVTWLIYVGSFLGLLTACAIVGLFVWTLFWVTLDCGCVVDPYHRIRTCEKHRA
jgi:hypothetical protein